MTNNGWVWYIVDWLSLPVLMIVSGIFVWRKLYREFPFFFSYLVIIAVASVARIAAQARSTQTYFYAYWVSDLIITIFTFLAVYELFIKRLFPGFYKVRIYRYLFAAAASVAIFLGWLTAIESHNAAAALISKDRILDSVLVAILVFFVLLMLLMGRQWTKYDFGIAFGFAIYAAAFLVTSALWVRTHYRPTALDELPVIAYDISSLVWLYCFWSGEKTSSTPPASSGPELLQQARSWESVLKKWLSSKKRAL
jgi:hypothetical protein